MPSVAKPGAARGKQRERPAAQVRIAALLTTHAPAGRLKLAPDPALKLHSELEFEPIAPVPGQSLPGVSFGLLRSGYLPKGLSFSRLAVKRGRWGGKPAEQLQLLQPVPEELLAQPALRVRGTLRSLSVALADLTTAQRCAESPPTITVLVLATEFALTGWAEAQRVQAFAATHAENPPQLRKSAGAPVVQTAGLFVWRRYLQRQAQRLGEVLKQARQRNPLRRELSETQIAVLLGLTQPGIAGAVLDEFAQPLKLRRAHGAYPRSYALAGEFAPPPLDAAGTACVKAVLADLAANPAASRRDFAARYPSQLNVIAWLYDSETLVELPGWYTVTRERLRHYLKQLPAGPGQRLPSVRDIKDRLGLARREAESLRAWYAAQVPPVAHEDDGLELELE